MRGQHDNFPLLNSENPRDGHERVVRLLLQSHGRASLGNGEYLTIFFKKNNDNKCGGKCVFQGSLQQQQCTRTVHRSVNPGFNSMLHFSRMTAAAVAASTVSIAVLGEAGIIV